MSAFSIKGVRIGTGQPKTIVSLMDSTEDKLVQRAHQATDAGADCLEWRADFSPDAHDPQAMAQTARALGSALPHTPLIFTFRSIGQGGQLDLTRDEYLSLNQAVIATEAIDLVDIEVGNGEVLVRSLVEHAHAHGIRAIVSHHDFSGTPATSEMVRELVHMATWGADIAKLAVMARDRDDALRLMQATSQAARLLGVPLLTMAMGEAGTISRLTGEAFGSALTFCSMGRPSAPGQVSIEVARDALGRLHAALLESQQ